jgi:hypothetical protein
LFKSSVSDVGEYASFSGESEERSEVHLFGLDLHRAAVGAG